LPRKKDGKKNNFVFLLPASLKKGKQARSAGNARLSEGQAEVRAPRLRVGGQMFRLLCPTEVFASLD
jgi:hypothetical protein